MRTFESLTDEAKATIILTQRQFADLFDNDEFGPFLQDFSKMDDDRYASLLEIAIGNLLYLVLHTGVTWNVDNFIYSRPIARQCAILSLTVEIIKHFIRSYVEIPDNSKIGAPTVSRRDYLSRWQSVLKDYQEQLKTAAKKLDSELYMDDFESGITTKVLADYPSMVGWAAPILSAERPIYGGW